MTFTLAPATALTRSSVIDATGASEYWQSTGPGMSAALPAPPGKPGAGVANACLSCRGSG